MFIVIIKVKYQSIANPLVYTTVVTCHFPYNVLTPVKGDYIYTQFTKVLALKRTEEIMEHHSVRTNSSRGDMIIE